MRRLISWEFERAGCTPTSYIPLARLTRLICERRATRLIGTVFARDRSIDHDRRRRGDPSSTSYNETNEERPGLDGNTTTGDPTSRTLDAERRSIGGISPWPLNSTLIWILRASLPVQLGGPVASSPRSSLHAWRIYLFPWMPRIRGKGSCRPRVIQMHTALEEGEGKLCRGIK